MSRTYIAKSLSSIPVEGAHGGSGRRQMLFSAADAISGSLEAATKGFLDPGGIFDWHNHKGIDEFFIVLKGQGNITYRVDEKPETRAYNPGDLFYSPSGMFHRIEATGTETNEFIFVRIRHT